MTEAKATSSSLARHGAVMAAGSLVSRITGFMRNVVIGAALGTTLGDAYSTAQYFPLMVYELVLGGILTSVVVPLIVRAAKNDSDQGLAFTQRLITLAIGLLAAATACVVAAAPLLARLMGNQNNYELVTQLSYLMLPALFFFGLSALMQAVLNTRNHFAAPMWAPILNNVMIIGTGLSFYGLYTVNMRADALGLDEVTTPMVLLLGLGTLSGIVVQSLTLLVTLRRIGFRWKWRFDFGKLPLSEIGKLAGWILCYVAFNQVGVVISINIANAAGANGGPGPLIYNNSYLFMTMAHGIVAVSVITALMPRLSAAASEHRYSDMAAELSSGLRLATLVLVPITVMYVVAGTPLAIGLFQWGRFDMAAAEATGFAIALCGLALIPFSISQFQTFAFYALTDGKTVALINIPVIATRVGGYLLSLALLPPQYVVAALMVSNGMSYLVGVVLQTTMLRRRIGLLGMRHIASTWAKQGISGIASAAVGLLVLQVLPDVATAGKALLFGEIAILGIVVLGVYFGVAYLLRIGEVHDLLRMVRRKLGR